MTLPAHRSPVARFGAFLLALLVAVVLGGCTPAERQTAGAIVSGLVSAAPVACTVVTAEDGTAAGNACSQDVGAASAVAQMVAKLLASFPGGAAAGMRKLGSTAQPGTVELKVVQNGTPVDLTLSLPPAMASYVATHYPTRSGQ